MVSFRKLQSFDSPPLIVSYLPTISLGPLSRRVKEPQLQEIVDTLCTHLLNEKKGGEELRDIASIGLKTIITEIPAEPAAAPSLITKRLTPRLITGVNNVSCIPISIDDPISSLIRTCGRVIFW